jgi:hypothetical protein
MPEFVPSPTPHNLDSFTQGYLEFAEWLAIVMCDRPDMSLTSDERDRCKGFTRAAIAQAKRDCQDFQESFRAELQTCYDFLDYEPSQAGHDFWLTRNRHGTGFWDRYYGDNKEVCAAYKKLTDMSHAYGGVECEFYRNRLHISR